MKVVGIIAEYNPFHNGHAYQIEQIRQQEKADYVIVAMSGNFVQRGTPAITDKYTRAAMALSCGADLVLEIPSLWATASAEYFATAGVRLLASTGVVTHLCFGVEDNNLDTLSFIADTLVNNIEEIQPEIDSFLKEGLSYPLARSKALEKIYPEYSCQTLLSSPNNILAIEYLKALKTTNIQPLPILRKGDGYHTAVATESNTSATAIRKIIEGEFESHNAFSNIEAIEPFVPAKACQKLVEALNNGQFVFPDDMSEMLYYSLWQSSKKELLTYADCNRELIDRITNHLESFTCYEDFVMGLKSKELTHTRIRRALLHILLKHTKTTYQQAVGMDYCPYLRIIGFRSNSSQLLNAIKNSGTSPLISKVADAQNILNPDAYQLFQMDLASTDLYNELAKVKHKASIANDYRHTIEIESI